MKKLFLTSLLGFLSVVTLWAQDTLIKGSVVDAISNEPISEVLITIEETNQTQLTDVSGEFSFTSNVPIGEQVLRISKVGYTTKRYPIVVNQGKTVNITDMSLELDTSDKSDFTIMLSDDELNGDNDGVTDNVSGLLQASRDVFLNASAFDFSATFFRPRGLDNANGKVLINGIEMNKQFNGRPQWANWGGLNDVQRNQEFARGLAASDYTFGDLAGTTNLVMRASKYREGGRVSVASANRSYRGRVMGSYSSGLIKDGWAYTILASRRFGNEGFIKGTLYDANSFFASLEKKIGDKHSLNFTSIYAQNRRGRATAITDEIYRLKGRTYNPFWGELDGEFRNTRVRNIEEPIVMLNHYWDMSSKTQLNTNIAYQFGSVGNTRVDNNGSRIVNFDGNDIYVGGARNPGPEYWQNLPSFFLQDQNPSAFDYQQAFLAQQQFINDGQFNWRRLYEGNASNPIATYAIQEDRVDDKQLMASIILKTQLADNITLNASVNYRNLKSENFAEVADLLGAEGYLDIDGFAEQGELGTDNAAAVTAQSNLRTPNRIARLGERYKYNYEIEANVASAFAQAQFSYNSIDFYLAGNLANTAYQRNGLYENGYFPGSRSFGKSKKLNFTTFGAKAGLTYKLSGKHLLDLNGAYMTKAPTIRNSFGNARQNNDIVRGLEEEQIQSVDASYIFRSPIVKARLTGFLTNFSNGTDIGFYFTDGNAGAFIQEVITNVERRHIGGELGLEAQVTPTVKLKAVAAVGQYTFTNNPDLYLTGDDFRANENASLTFGDGKTYLDGYHLAGGPERAFQLGFEYRDPDFWNIGITANHFSNAYVDVNNLKRTERFSTNLDLLTEDEFRAGGNISGLTFNDYNEATARRLLQQEQLNDYMLVNVVGGKSWKVGDYFVGFFATINNIFDVEYKTGGFEQARGIDYRAQLEQEASAGGPTFGNRYFHGNGTTYYLNFYLRF